MSDFDDMSDAELITRSRDGDSAAFAALYERHRVSALRVATKLDGPVSADDLVAEAFTRVFAILQRGGGPDFAFRPYLITAVRNAYVTHVRTDSKLMLVSDHSDLEDQSLPDEASERQESSVLSRAFRSLPERWQVVLWHGTVEQESTAQIGEVLGLSANAVAALSYRAREGFRQAYLAEHLALADNDDCRATRELLPAYSRGQLGVRQTRHTETHLDDCRACTAAITELKVIGSQGFGAILAPAIVGALAASALPALSAGTAGTVAAGAAGGSASSGVAAAPKGPWTVWSTKGIVAAVATSTTVVAIAVAVLIASRGDDAAVVRVDDVVPTTVVSQPSTPPVSQNTPPVIAPPVVPTVVPTAPPAVEPTTPRPSSTKPTPTPSPSPSRTPKPTPPPTVPAHDLTMRLSSFERVTSGTTTRVSLRMPFESAADGAVLTITVSNLRDYTVAPSSLASQCTSSGNGTISCAVGASSGVIDLDLTVETPSQLTASLAATGNEDPDGANNQVSRTIS